MQRRLGRRLAPEQAVTGLTLLLQNPDSFASRRTGHHEQGQELSEATAHIHRFVRAWGFSAERLG